MKTTGFRKLETKELEQTYGGWQWLIALIPMVIQAVTTAVIAIKSLSVTDGSIKTKDLEAKWSAPKEPKGRSETKQYIYYAY